jgi:hypothetical protein
MNAAKEKGLVRSEGKEYIVKEGDVMLSVLMSRLLTPRRHKDEVLVRFWLLANHCC